MNEGSFFLQTVGYILVSGVFVVIFYSILKEDLIEFTSHWKRHLLIAIISFAVMYGLTELTNYIFYLLKLPLSSSNQDFIINALKSETFIYVAISVVFLAPFVEEVIFRKLLFGAIESNLKLPKIVVVIISTVIFSLIHLSSEITLVFSDISNFKYLVAFFLYAPLAFVLSFSYSYSKNNIFTVIIVHMLNNLLSIILILVL
jgi:membrane protease YdiL (CAAX protease family)